MSTLCQRSSSGRRLEGQRLQALVVSFHLPGQRLAVTPGGKLHRELAGESCEAANRTGLAWPGQGSASV